MDSSLAAPASCRSPCLPSCRRWSSACLKSAKTPSAASKQQVINISCQQYTGATVPQSRHRLNQGTSHRISHIWKACALSSVVGHPLPHASRLQAWAARPHRGCVGGRTRTLSTVLRPLVPCFPIPVSRGAHLALLSLRHWRYNISASGAGCICSIRR